MSGLYLPEEVFQGDLEQTASRINSVLNDIRRAMESDARLGALVKYQLKEKGQNEQLRFAKLLKYEGPDAMTIQLLRSQQGEWVRDPYTFWSRGASPDISVLQQQQAHIIGIYLQAKCVDA
ncbi:hypothetical protein H2202_009776 [Exophiala xenobiotica]|nr:hypothetical protein H2202_009776 [Exophiala xenobiotica]